MFTQEILYIKFHFFMCYYSWAITPQTSLITFTFSKATIETLEEGVKYVQTTLHWFFYC